MAKRRSAAATREFAQLADPNATYVPSVDGYGESDIVHIRLPRSVLAEVQAAVEAPDCPWEDRHAYIRYAVWKGMGDLRKFKIDPKSNEHLLDLMIEQARSSRDAIKFDLWIEELQTTVDAHIRHGAVGKARELALGAIRGAKEFKNPEQRKFLVRKLTEMWKGLLESAQVELIVGLGDEGGEGESEGDGDRGEDHEAI